jgi:hypothetical protein
MEEKTGLALKTHSNSHSSNRLPLILPEPGSGISVCRSLLLISVLLLSSMLSCSYNGEEGSLVIANEVILDSIPSGSGLVIRNNNAYLISDDGTGVYLLNLFNYHHTKVPLTGFAYDLYREEKALKRDFETATLVNWRGKEYLLAFGSGSKTHRDSMLMLNIEKPSEQQIVALGSFYRQLQLLTHTDSSQWNIEGATTAGENLFLFNRGNNMIVSLRSDEFLAHLFNTSTFPQLKYQKIKLPSLGNREARLSGACTLDDEHILFSASVEDTPDWTSDGPVLGSFIGLYSIRDQKILASYTLRNGRGEPQKDKLESLDVLRREPNGDISIIAVGDNDNGTSKLLHLRLKLPAQD